MSGHLEWTRWDPIGISWQGWMFCLVSSFYSLYPASLFRLCHKRHTVSFFFIFTYLFRYFKLILSNFSLVLSGWNRSRMALWQVNSEPSSYCWRAWVSEYGGFVSCWTNFPSHDDDGVLKVEQLTEAKVSIMLVRVAQLLHLPSMQSGGRQDVYFEPNSWPHLHDWPAHHLWSS